MNSAVLRWPDAQVVEAALRVWAAETALGHPEVTRIGFFGSYARGDWGVGSDLDVVIVCSKNPTPFGRRPLAYDTGALPVPADVFVYTEDEFARLPKNTTGMQAHVATGTRWVWRESSG